MYTASLVARTMTEARPHGRYPFLAIALLTLVGTTNYIDRVLPSILAQSIKRDLALSDTALGLINGSGFLIVYGLASIPLARISDRGHYSRVIVLCLALWSAMTLIGAWASSAMGLAASRLGVALGEAGSIPATHAYIARHVSPASRTMTLAVFNGCLPIGSMLGFIVGGFAGTALGWRGTFILMGALGLALAALCQLTLGWFRPGFTTVAGSYTSTPHAQGQFARLIAVRGLLPILAGSAFMAMGGYTGVAFNPAFLMRSHGLDLPDAGLTFGVAAGLAALAGLLCLGWIANILSRRDPRWLLGTVVVMIAAGLPLSFVAYSAADLHWAVTGLAVNHMLSVAQVAPVFAAVHRLVPVELRAQASALLLLAGAFLGGLGPFAAGAISDMRVEQLGERALASAMIVVPIAYALGMVCFALAVARFPRSSELEEA